MDRPFMFRDPVAAKAGPAKLDIWLEVRDTGVLLRARHEGDGAEQNLAAIGFDHKTGQIYLESLPLAPWRKEVVGDRVRNLRRLLGGRLIDLRTGTIEDDAEPTSAPIAGEA